MAELAEDRLEAIGRANMEAEAAVAASIREEADRLLQEHRDRTAQLQEEMKVRGNGNAGANANAGYRCCGISCCISHGAAPRDRRYLKETLRKPSFMGF